MIGGILMIVGFLPRLTMIPLIFTMIVAYLTAHNEELFSIFTNTEKFLSAPPFLFMFASFIILIFGAGKYSFYK